MAQPGSTPAMEPSGASITPNRYFFYSLFLAANGTPFASNFPISLELPATSSFAMDEVPEPRRVKQLLEFIGSRENIHPSRLWFTSLRGNEKRKMKPTSGSLRGLPSTAEVPPAPDATYAAITVHLTRPFRREDARTSPSVVFLAIHASLDTRRRLEQSPIYNTVDAIAGFIAATCCMFCLTALTIAAADGRHIVYTAPDGREYYSYD